MSPHRQFLVFVLVGLLCAALDVTTMQLLIAQGTNALLAASLSFLLGLILNFALHSSVTFGAPRSARNLARFMVVVLVNYLFTLALVKLSLLWLGNALVGKLVSLPCVAANGFLLSRAWVFR